MGLGLGVEKPPTFSVRDEFDRNHQTGAADISDKGIVSQLLAQAVATCPEPLVCDQVEYHPYIDQTKVRQACAQHHIGLVAYSPIAKGAIKKDQTLKRIGWVHRKSPAQVCLRWLVQQDVSAIPRTSRIERLSENLDIFDFTLSDDEMADIFALASASGRLTDFGFAPKWD